MYVWEDAKRILLDTNFKTRWCTPLVKVNYLPVHVAFLYSGRTLVCFGCNISSWKHAEMDCMQKAKRFHFKRGKPLRLIVLRLSNGKIAMSRPCRMCCTKLKHLLPRARILYSDADGRLSEETSFDNTHLSCANKRPYDPSNIFDSQKRPMSMVADDF